MSEHEHGTLTGKKVKNRKAVAIAMSEAGQSKKRKKASLRRAAIMPNAVPIAKETADS
jgi:hypothetical protein